MWRLVFVVFRICLFAAKASVLVWHCITQVLTVWTPPLLLLRIGERGLRPLFNAINVEHLIAQSTAPYGRIGFDN